MIFARAPSLSAQVSEDDDRLASERGFTRLRSQVAVVRALADHVERIARPADSDQLTDQLIEEMTRLGSRLLDAARPRKKVVWRLRLHAVMRRA